MKIVAVIIALEAVASAQPQPDVDPAPSAEPAPVEAAPAQPPPPTLPSGYDMAVRMTNAARNAAARGKCALIDSLDRRVRELDAAYYEQVFATDATIARCRPNVSPPGMVAVAPPPARHSALTIEAGVGAGLSTDGEATLRGLGGPAFGIGGFVTPTLAFTVRLSGSVAFVEGAFLYVGVLGPNAQTWLNDHVWLGGGLGLAIAVGCDEGCDHITGFGVDTRLGYAFRPRGQSGANVSVEAMYESFGSGSGDGLTTVAVMLGYQSF